MSYMALYRKFRPSSFEEVKGQDAIVTTLKNQVKTERVGHAYLFCGTRGTGKTTIAKILAKAVNCEHPVDGSPCNECSVCQKINRQASMNVIEIDAASNNGVDNIREIVEEVQYSPTEGRYKVYIIDEVHMLSAGAFNALLKTLEEPPSYVIFILATTEVHKIPITILSRCQRYDFRRISIDTIAARLSELMVREGVEAEEKAIRYVAKVADGSMRDALSLLDQCLAFHFGESLTYDKVLKVLGAVDTETFDRMFGLLLNGNVMGLLGLVEEIVLEGKELGQFVSDYIWFLRNLLILKASEGSGDLVDVQSELLPLMVRDSTLMSEQELVRQIRVLSDLASQLKYSTQKRVITEITLVKLCVPQMEPNIENLNARIEKLERALAEGRLIAAPLGAASGELPLGNSLADQAEVSQEPPVMRGMGENGSGSGNISSIVTPAPSISPEKALPEELQKIAANWNSLITKFKMPVRQYMREAMPSVNENGELELVVVSPMTYGLMNEEHNMAYIQKSISEYMQKEVPVACRLEASGSKENVYDIRFAKLNMEIEWED